MFDIFFTLTPEASAVPIPNWLDLASVVVGSLTGCIVAEDRKLDLVGFVGLALLCGLGGGLLRDVAMQRGGIYMLDSPYAIPGAVLIGLASFAFPTPFFGNPAALEWLDIVSVGLFVASGTDKAVRFALSPWAIILMGTLTGVGGGMLRDVFLGDVPRIFRQSNLYAVCAVAGSATYLICVALGLRKVWAALLCVLVTVALRRASLRFGILSPAEVDLTPRVMAPVRRLKRRVRLTRHGVSRRK